MRLPIAESSCARSRHFSDEGAGEAAREIAVRYLGPAAGEAYTAAGLADDIVIRLEPGTVRAWDFADEY